MYIAIIKYTKIYRVALRDVVQHYGLRILKCRKKVNETLRRQCSTHRRVGRTCIFGYTLYSIYLREK